MIGDYVSLGGKTMQVLSIGEENHNGDRLLTLHELNGGIWQSIADHAVEPIEITESLLRINGWKRVVGSSDIFPEYRLYLDKTKNIFLEIRKNDSKNYKYCGINGTVGFLRYVHQLQQVIRLCGGKEIVL